MAAAVSAARRGASVTILEKKEMAGKKILSTGNGRCNLTNMDMKAVYFRGGDQESIQTVLSGFGSEDTLRFFSGMGLMTKTRGTLVYPCNDQAAAVREALSMELKRLGVQILTGTVVKKALSAKGRFCLEAEGPEGHVRQTGDRLILAMGGKAAPALGSDGSGYQTAADFGHRIIRPLPALVQLRSGDPSFKKLAGIRADAAVMLYIDDKPAASDQGEIQFTDYGISGIPVFQVSRFAAEALDRNQKVTAVLDLAPWSEGEELTQLFVRRQAVFLENTAEEFLHGIFHRKLAPVLLTRACIRWKEKVKQIDQESLKRLAAVCKRFEVPVAGTNSFEQAQVCAGGVPLDEICPETMESRICPGLYLTGELLDVDGMCGGYNLQWAWSTGYLAGMSAAENTSLK